MTHSKPETETPSGAESANPTPGGDPAGKRRRRGVPPVLIAGAFILAVSGWMASSHLGIGQDKQQSSMVEETEKAPDAFRVAVESRSAKPITRFILVQGHLKPDRTVTLRAETAGRVKEVVAKKGARVDAGDVIVRIDPGDRMAKLAQAKAKVEETRRDLEAARQLIGKGYQTEARVKALESANEAAKANLEAIQVDIDRLVIRAPFAGVLNDRSIEEGGYLAVRDPIATIVDDDPVVGVADVAQQNVSRLKVGQKAQVDLITGKTVEGRIRYISAQADEQTRTYATEIEVPNPEHANIAGSTAQIRIPTETIRAHFMSARLLSLGEKEQLGVKTVDERGRVVFHPVEVIRATSNGVWVSGLPETVRLIVRGQGFVRDGQTVRTVPADKDGPRAARPAPAE